MQTLEELMQAVVELTARVEKLEGKTAPAAPPKKEATK